MEYKLINEIIKISESKNWENAKHEWEFQYVYRNPKTQSCLCGKKSIVNVCIIKNAANKKVAEVGNCCVNKFLGIEKGNNLFEAINRLNKDITKSLGVGALEYLNSKNLLTELQYNFYKSSVRKWKLSTKQMATRIGINRKFLEITSYDVTSTSSRINKVLSFAENNKTADLIFLRSLKEYFETNGKLTERQNYCLNFHVEKLKIA
ncbi:MAG: hypothetical protein WC716_04385 [Chitinophagaceae bacterium]|jgi:hypothetical protein